jgi:hypothetical protein
VRVIERVIRAIYSPVHHFLGIPSHKLRMMTTPRHHASVQLL